MTSRLGRLLLIIVPLLGILFSAPVASAWYTHPYYGHFRRHYHHHRHWRDYGYNRRFYYDRDWRGYPWRYRDDRYSRAYPYEYYRYRGHRDD